MTIPTTQRTTFIVLVVQVVLDRRVQPSRCSLLIVCANHPNVWLKEWTNVLQTLSKHVISLLFFPSPNSRSILVYPRWLAMAAAEVAVVSEDAVVVAEVAVDSRAPTLLLWVEDDVGRC